jgi:hypothetical protein
VLDRALHLLFGLEEGLVDHLLRRLLASTGVPRWWLCGRECRLARFRW